MNILITGCSFVTELSDLFAKAIPGSKITNLSAAGAGNRYIADSVVATAREKFDFIYVSWTGLSRYDVCVEDISLFRNPDWGSSGDLYGRQYIFSGGEGGWLNKDTPPMVKLLFSGYHKFLSTEQLHYNSLMEIVKTQGYLKSLGVPYYFGSMLNQFDPKFNEWNNFAEKSAVGFPTQGNQDLIDQIDFDRWFLTEHGGVYETCKNLGYINPEVDPVHPNIDGYCYCVNLLVDHLRQKQILK